MPEIMTAAKLKSLASMPVDKPVKISIEKGLFLLVTPGGSRHWRLKYRFGGKEKLLALGAYPEMSLANAREARDKHRAVLRQGVDPSAARAADKRAQRGAGENTFERVAGRWLLKWQGDKAAGTRVNTERRLFLLNAELGSMPIADIRPRDVAGALEQIEAKTTTRVAAYCLGVASNVFKFARTWELIETNPAADLRGVLGVVKGGHRQAQVSVSGLAEVLQAIDSYPGLVVRSLLSMLPLVFVRPGELRAMRWADLHLDGSDPDWRYRIPKTDTDHIVPLSRQALAIIEGLRPLTGGEVFVFAARTGRPISNSTVSWAMKHRSGLDGLQMAHGFRATARTMLDERLGFRVDLIEHQLGHVVRDPLGRAYNRTAHIEERRRMMQVWADFLDEVRTGVVGGNNVVELRKVG